MMSLSSLSDGKRRVPVGASLHRRHVSLQQNWAAALQNGQRPTRPIRWEHDFCLKLQDVKWAADERRLTSPPFLLLLLLFVYAEVAKRVSNILRVVLSLQQGDAASDSLSIPLAQLAPHITRLPMPEDYSLEELRGLTQSYLRQLIVSQWERDGNIAIRELDWGDESLTGVCLVQSCVWASLQQTGVFQREESLIINQAEDATRQKQRSSSSTHVLHTFL